MVVKLEIFAPDIWACPKVLPRTKQAILYGVMQGKGAFAGQTIIIDGTRLVGKPFQWTGTIITP